MGAKRGQARRIAGGGAILRPQFSHHHKEATLDKEALEAKRAAYQQELQRARAELLRLEQACLRFEGAILAIDELLGKLEPAEPPAEAQA